MADLLDEYTKRTVQIGGTTFHFRQLLPHEAYDCLEIIRFNLAGRLEMLNTSVEILGANVSSHAVLAFAKSVGQILGLIEPAVVKELQRRMFKEVTFTNTTSQSPTQLTDNIPEAFKGLTPIRIYEVTVRAFVINFMPSFEDAKSLLASLNLDFDQLTTQMQNPSSQSQSTPSSSDELNSSNGATTASP